MTQLVCRSFDVISINTEKEVKKNMVLISRPCFKGGACSRIRVIKIRANGDNPRARGDVVGDKGEMKEDDKRPGYREQNPRY